VPFLEGQSKKLTRGKAPAEGHLLGEVIIRLDPNELFLGKSAFHRLSFSPSFLQVVDSRRIVWIDRQRLSKLLFGLVMTPQPGQGHTPINPCGVFAGINVNDL
jgi:hypothetical protein